MPNIACVNGLFMPLKNAKVSVEDRGYQFGDGIYEVIRAYQGKPFCIEKHLSRFEESARAISLSLRYPREEWVRMIRRTLSLSKFREAKIYCQATRGVAPRDHPFPSSSRSTAVVTVRAHSELSPQYWEEGVAVMLVEDIRWGRCDIKSVNLLPNILAKQKAREHGFFEAIFVREKEVTEGSGSNICAVCRGVLVTPPLCPFLLSGVTRELVLEIARKEGVKVEERSISPEELIGAEEVFLTSTTVAVLPVVRVDTSSIGNGRPGELTRFLYRRFQSAVEAIIRETE